jgi:hypothetical protein
LAKKKQAEQQKVPPAEVQAVLPDQKIAEPTQMKPEPAPKPDDAQLAKKKKRTVSDIKEDKAKAEAQTIPEQKVEEPVQMKPEPAPKPSDAEMAKKKAEELAKKKMEDEKKKADELAAKKKMEDEKKKAEDDKKKVSNKFRNLNQMLWH